MSECLGKIWGEFIGEFYLNTDLLAIKRASRLAEIIFFKQGRWLKITECDFDDGYFISS